MKAFGLTSLLVILFFPGDVLALSCRGHDFDKMVKSNKGNFVVIKALSDTASVTKEINLSGNKQFSYKGGKTEFLVLRSFKKPFKGKFSAKTPPKGHWGPSFKKGEILLTYLPNFDPKKETVNLNGCSYLRSMDIARGDLKKLGATEREMNRWGAAENQQRKRPTAKSKVKAKPSLEEVFKSELKAIWPNVKWPEPKKKKFSYYMGQKKKINSLWVGLKTRKVISGDPRKHGWQEAGHAAKGGGSSTWFTKGKYGLYYSDDDPCGWNCGDENEAKCLDEQRTCEKTKGISYNVWFHEEEK